jgi:hypothetical protein
MTSPEYTLTCPPDCSLRERSEVSDAIASKVPYSRVSKTFGISTGTLSRHRKHMHIEDSSPEDPSGVPALDGKVPHLSVLEAIIAAGWANRSKWRPTIGDTMKAMDMYQKVTQGSAFQDLLDALASDVVEDDDFAENPAAVSEVVGGNN